MSPAMASATGVLPTTASSWTCQCQISPDFDDLLTRWSPKMGSTW